MSKSKRRPKRGGADAKRSSTPRAGRPDMPGYGIVDAHSGDGLLPWKWAVERLSKTQNYFLITVRSDGRPHVMPVWGVWMDGAFYFGTDKHSVKARNLAHNPRCIVCPGGADEAVILEGVAAQVSSKAVFKKFVAVYLKKYKWDMSEMGPVFEVRPQLVFGQIEKTYTKSATRWRF